MIVIEVSRSLCLALGRILRCELLVEEVGRDVVYINELDTSLLYHLAIPFAIGVIASLYLAVGPFVARREGE